MSPIDDFVHISTGPGSARPAPPSVSGEFLENSKGDRLFTEGLIVESLRRHHPKHHLSVTPAYLCDLIAFSKDNNDVTCLPHTGTQGLRERIFLPPARRYNDDIGGRFLDRIVFGCYDYVFKGNQFLVYVVEGADGAFGKNVYSYILVEDLTVEGKAAPQKLADELIEAATAYGQELHNEVLVFDQGFWQKSADLWHNIQKSNWEDVILEEERKKAIVDDVIGFFDGQERYQEFGVPWKVIHNSSSTKDQANYISFREASYSMAHQE